MNNLEVYYAAKEAYYAGDPVLSDADFDTLERALITTHPEILLSIGSSQRSGKVKLPHAVGSLNQKHDEPELRRWAEKIRGKFLITEKIDGNSCLIVYRDGKFVDSFSRGDGVNGACNSRHTVKMPNVPKLFGTFSGTVRGELVISKSNWVIVKALAESNAGRTFANSRNFIAGFLNRSDSLAEIYNYVTFVAFDLYTETAPGVYGVYSRDKSTVLAEMQKFGFTIPGFSVSDSLKEYAALDRSMSILIAASEYELDGLVIEADSYTERSALSTSDDLNPASAIKIKPASKGEVTTVTGVEWNVSKDGLLKPVVHFMPVQLTGVTISKASGYNARNIVDAGIGIGATVLITRRGDVIPCVEQVIVPVDAVLPPNSHWNINNVELVADLQDSVEQDIRKLEYFFSKLGVEFMGPANVRALVESRIDTPTAAILAECAEYENIIGANGAKAYIQLHAILGNITPELLFAALDEFGRGIGERKLRALIAGIGVDAFFAGTYGVCNIISIDGFDIKTAELIIENRECALDTFADIKHAVTFATVAPILAGKLSGQVFCATGVRLDAGIQETIKSQGGTIVDSLTSAVTVLVAKDPDSNSSKMTKARARGVKIVSLAELTGLL